MQFNFSNVNDAFKTLVMGIADETIPTVEEESRNGPVLRIPQPVLIGYSRPWERVLFNTHRDANPFFHLFEALWMLAGRNDVATLKKYNSKIADIASDDGKTFNGAYGYRWRHARKGGIKSPEAVGLPQWSPPGIDQLEIIINHLKACPDSRRAVLQMWNVQDDLLKVGPAIDTRVLYSKDVCCNTAAYFSLRDLPANGPHASMKALDMTVTNRSNDLIWGCLGANVVHFSFLHEYLASRLGVGVGHYYQFTNNLHVYKEYFEGNVANWLAAYQNRNAHSPVIDYTDSIRTMIPIGGSRFDEELQEFVDALLCSGYKATGFLDMEGLPTEEVITWKNSFLSMVAWPMKMAFDAHKKNRNYDLALDWCKTIMADDWREVCTRWIERRRDAWEAKRPRLTTQEPMQGGD